MSPTVCIVAQFRNEQTAMKEWIDHYLAEGVSHFYLIDNGSTDDSCAKLQPYIDAKVVTLAHDPTPFTLVENYNKYYLSACKAYDWVLVCDLDEFVYARRGFVTIPEAIAHICKATPDVTNIGLVWKWYGGNGCVRQPPSIIQGFTQRGPIGRLRNGHTKYITRTSTITRLGNHGSKQTTSVTVFAAPQGETTLREAVLHINHYMIQSREWYLTVKAAPDRRHGRKVRGCPRHSPTKYNEYEQLSSGVYDDELARKRNGVPTCPTGGPANRRQRGLPSFRSPLSAWPTDKV